MSGNDILTSIKGHNSVTNLQKMTANNPKQDLVNINSYIKFGQNMSICSQYIERTIKGNISVKNKQKIS